MGQFLKRSAGRDVLLGVSLLEVVCVFAGAFELCHKYFRFRIRKGRQVSVSFSKRLSHLACRPLKKKFICVVVYHYTDRCHER